MNSDKMKAALAAAKAEFKGAVAKKKSLAQSATVPKTKAKFILPELLP